MTLLLLLACFGGCVAPTSLSCGTDENQSYVTLNRINNNAPQTLKAYAELCGFKGASNATTQNVEN